MHARAEFRTNTSEGNRPEFQNPWPAHRRSTVKMHRPKRFSFQMREIASWADVK